MAFINKWFSFTAGCFIQLFVSGVMYAFGVYAEDLKRVFHWDQKQIQGVASPLFSPFYLAWLPGLVYDSLQHRPQLGPRWAAVPRPLLPITP